MIAFDTDVLTEILLGDTRFMARAAAIPTYDQSVPIIVIEEIMRGRLNIIRQAEAGKTSITLPQAYEFFAATFADFRRLQVLSYDEQAESHYQKWRQSGIRLSTHDLRIGAICVSHSAKLISRNRRDFARIPGLDAEFWE